MAGASQRDGAHVVVTGAGGFIGERLAQHLLRDPAWASVSLTLNDLKLPNATQHARVRIIEGDFGDAAVRERALGSRADVVFHLAGVLGGAAEANYDLARRVNVDATLSLMDTLRDAERPPRFVFASSIAIFGPTGAVLIDDDTPASPIMTYGAQKRMIEIALEQFSARGWLDGLALRLPGIVARPNADARLKTAFLNAMFYAFAAGDDITLPVSPEGTTWLISAPACVEALAHAGLLAADRLGPQRAFTLPAQRVTFAQLIAALRVRFPESATRVVFEPDTAIEAQFARQPPLETPLADRLGFQHDGNIAALVARALPGDAL